MDERIELDDAAVLTVLDRMVKQRKDSVTQYEAAAREDLAAIDAAIALVSGGSGGAPGPADMGKLMGVLKPQLAGQADMGQVSALVKKRLAG